MGILTEAIESARRGDSTCVWISGPRGIGKSRLIAEACRYATWRGSSVQFGHRETSDASHDLGGARVGAPIVLVLDPHQEGDQRAIEKAIRETSSGLCIVATHHHSSDPPALPDFVIFSLRLGALEHQHVLDWAAVQEGRPLDSSTEATLLKFRGHPGRIHAWLANRNSAKWSPNPDIYLSDN